MPISKPGGITVGKGGRGGGGGGGGGELLRCPGVHGYLSQGVQCGNACGVGSVPNRIQK